jgi:hypothetical protein
VGRDTPCVFGAKLCSLQKKRSAVLRYERRSPNRDDSITAIASSIRSIVVKLLRAEV